MVDLQNTLSSLDDYFTLNRGALETLKELCLGLFKARTVNLQEICADYSAGNFASNMRKIERFFQMRELREEEVIKFIIDRLFGDEALLTLAIDRTEWQFGSCWHNLLCISVLYGNTAIVIGVLPLERRGNSNTKQRIGLLQTILSVIPKSRIAALLGDREFIGDEWLQTLKKLNIPFVMRIRDNITVSTQEKTDKISAFIPKEGQEYIHNIHCGTGLFDLSLKKCKQDNLALISSGIADPIQFYRKRWAIETGFKCLKTGGFNLEDTHLKIPKRVKLLTQICALAMTLSFQAFAQNTLKKTPKTP